MTETKSISINQIDSEDTYKKLLAKGMIGDNDISFIEATDIFVSLGVTGASVGDIVKVKAVDENGVPTEWEANRMEKIVDTTLTEDAIFSYTFDQPLNEIVILVCGAVYDSSVSIPENYWGRCYLTDSYGTEISLNGVKFYDTTMVSQVNTYCKIDGSLMTMGQRINRAAASGGVPNIDGFLYNNRDSSGTPNPGYIVSPIKNIKKVYLNEYATKVTLPSGTKIVIWGRNA